MKHIQLEIFAGTQEQEELIAQLDELHSSGFEQRDEKLIAYFPEKDFSLEALSEILDGYQYGITNIEEQNWNAVWESNFQPVMVADFCAVRAHFHEPIKEVQHEILITPKMSFGTGHHATTYMMMQQMQEMDFRHKKVFDFGTGTGVLAILAHKLGAEEITAIDVDEWSIENAKENFQQNNCSDITVTRSSDLPDRQFDIILANINRNVILDYLHSLVEHTKQSGFILLSGLLATDENDIVAAAEQNGLKVIRRVEKQGWISLLTVMAQ